LSGIEGIKEVDMILMETRCYFIKIKRIWFSDSVYEVEGCTSVFFRECKRQIIAQGFSCRQVTNSVIDLTQDLGEIWKGMKRSSCRNAIKQAQRKGVIVEINQNFDEFYNIYISHKNHKKHIRWYDIEDKATMKKYGILFTAKYDDKILGGHVYLEDRDNILYWISATNRFTEDRELRTLIGNASHLIHWEAIKYAKAKGIKEFNLSGLHLGDDDPKNSLNIFKESFGGKRVTYYTYYKDYNNVFKLIRNLSNLSYIRSRGFSASMAEDRTSGKK
jgi:lipid II:glycine glycyltransferase (peptidoglycan interpeptide bridge formation enzyme)